MSERRYRMVRIRAGDYILPSNDGKMLWRIVAYEEDGSWTYQDAKGRERSVTGSYWATWKYDRPFHNMGEWQEPDFLEWENWLHWEGPFRTRAEAVKSAIR